VEVVIIAPPNHQRCRFSNKVLIASWMVLFLPWLEDAVSTISKCYFRFWFVWPLHSFPLRLNPCWICFGTEETAEFLGSHMVSSPPHRALTCISGWHNSLWLQTRFLERFLSPCSDIYDRITFVFNALELQSEGPQISVWCVCTQRCHQSLWIFWWYCVL